MEEDHETKDDEVDMTGRDHEGDHEGLGVRDPVRRAALMAIRQ